MENMEIELKRLRKSMLITRIFCVIPAILFLIVIIGGGYIWTQVSHIVDNVMPATEAIGKVDWEEVVETLEDLETAVSDVDWVALSEKVEQFDVEALNKTLGEINTEELNKAVENLNDAAEAIRKITSIFK